MPNQNADPVTEAARLTREVVFAHAGSKKSTNETQSPLENTLSTDTPYNNSYPHSTHPLIEPSSEAIIPQSMATQVYHLCNHHSNSGDMTISVNSSRFTINLISPALYAIIKAPQIKIILPQFFNMLSCIPWKIQSPPILK